MAFGLVCLCQPGVCEVMITNRFKRRVLLTLDNYQNLVPWGRVNTWTAGNTEDTALSRWIRYKYSIIWNVNCRVYYGLACFGCRIKIPQIGQLKQQFLIVLEATSPWSRGHQISLLVRALFLACRQRLSHCILTFPLCVNTYTHTHRVLMSLLPFIRTNTIRLGPYLYGLI